MRIAFAQMNVAAGDKAANYSKVEELVEGFFAAGGAADIVLLPELWSTGYALKELNALASDEGEEEAEFLGRLARAHNVWFAGGSVAAKSSAGIFNRAQIVDRQGQLQAFYDKIHLVPMLDEPKYLAAGKSRCVHTIEGTHFGLAICYDLRFGELIRRLALDGAEVLLFSAQWPSVRAEHWKILVRARAIENQCYLFAANSYAEGPGGFAGHSVAIGPDGSILGHTDTGEGVCSATVDSKAVADMRRQVPVFANRRPELY